MDYHHDNLTRKPSLIYGYHNPSCGMDKNFNDIHRISYLQQPQSQNIQAFIAAAAAGPVVIAADENGRKARQQLILSNNNFNLHSLL